MKRWSNIFRFCSRKR